ncbi:MAG: CoB--CoM heterodisulfide reductase iron-sulfur subunit A family protein [Candidatus Bathyarchaeia archaeon]
MHFESAKNEEVRIGVYVCHCGTNIAGSVDVKKVAEYASMLPNVVIAREYTFVCSDVGQAIIQRDIHEFKLNRVVVASCSPSLHQNTFSNCVEAAGLNKYLVVMANIREQCSWVHVQQPYEATAKAMDLVRMAVARASMLEPLINMRVPVNKSCLIVGGGVSGIQAALDLANEGFEVYLVEKDLSIGGHMAQFDKTFPTMDCSMCILSPKMAEVAHHPKIHVMTNSEVKEVSGYIGNFKAKVLIKPRFVDPTLCNGCGECAEVCPIEVPNEFDEELGLRKAIYVPFPQAVPMVYTIDQKHCIKCYRCVQKCMRQAVDFTQEPKEIEVEVGTLIVATGYDSFNPAVLEEYGYGIYENVITALEFERILSPTGPTRGKIIRPSDWKPPKRIAFIQCVGSRDVKTNPYCSRVCCMYATKQALLIKEKIPDATVLIFYIDMRAFGKGYEEFYERAQREGIRYIRGRVADLVEDSKSKNLIVSVEDSLLGSIIETEVDLVILSVGLIPTIGTNTLCRVLNLSMSPDGFLKEAHPKLRPVDTLVEGIFVAGVAQGPKDIPDSVAQGSAAAQRASIIMSKGEAELEAAVARVNADLCSRCLICVDACPFGALRISEKFVEVNEALCKGCGTCASSCPSKAIEARHFNDGQIIAELKASFRK